MALVRVRWQIVEVHEQEIEVDDLASIDEEGWDDSLLAEHEDNSSYVATTERDVLEYEVLDDATTLVCAGCDEEIPAGVEPVYDETEVLWVGAKKARVWCSEDCLADTAETQEEGRTKEFYG